MKCPFCEACEGLTRQYDVRDRFGLSAVQYKVMRCGRCSSLTLDPLPKEDEVAAFYPESYNFKKENANSVWSASTKFIEWKLFYERTYARSYLICKQSLNKKVFSIFDVGCGSALRLKFMRDKGCSVAGNETSEACVSYASSQLGIEILLGSITEIDTKEQRFDLVSMFALLEHIPEPEKVITRVRAMLKDDGMLVVQVPVTDSLHYKLFGKRSAMILDVPRHINIPSQKGVELLMKRHNFELVRKFNISAAESAALFAFALMPGASAADTYKKPGLKEVFVRAAAWCAALFLGMPFAVLERLTGPAAEEIFVFTKCN